MERYYYLALDLLSIAFPLAASFEPRIAYWKKWRGLFTGIAVMAVVFLAWDAVFTANGVWGFSPRYTLGLDLFGLPIEEWLFFIAIPYSCVYLYEVMRYAIARDVLGGIARWLSVTLMIALLITGVLFFDRTYTAAAELRRRNRAEGMQIDRGQQALLVANLNALLAVACYTLFAIAP